MNASHTPIRKWLMPGIGLKRWLFALMLGLLTLGLGFSYGTILIIGTTRLRAIAIGMNWGGVALLLTGGVAITGLALINLSRRLLEPYRRLQQGKIIDVVYEHSKRQKGLRFVAIGGGTGLPSVLKGIKPYTSNITAIVNVADDGGSSGRLRRDMGVAPPGDIRNNIAALADDESVLTKLFQYRFTTGELRGHAFGNLFIAALASVMEQKSGKRNSLAEALVEIERVLNIQGRVLPATLDDVGLIASVRLTGTSRSIKIQGEAQIADLDGQMEEVSLNPSHVTAYPESVKAILEADVIVIGPGSLYTSILPNLLVKDIADALRATSAYKIYVCNVATQPVESDGYTVAEHVMALERHIGRGVFQVVLANDAYPMENAGQNTHYVMPVPDKHEIHQRYEVRYTDLTDSDRPWRHDPVKLGDAIRNLSIEERIGGISLVANST